MVKTASLLLVSGMLALGVSSGASAQSSGIDGSWSGGGKVVFPSGDVEHARCRVRYRRESATNFVAQASCATASGRVDQSASLYRTGANTYSGSFFNSQYGITGSINIVVSGSSQSVSLNGGGASASLRLSR